MALFEKKPGSPAGNITISTAFGTYVFGDSGTVTENDPKAIAELRKHPYVRQSGTTEVVPTATAEYYGVRYRTTDKMLVGVDNNGLIPPYENSRDVIRYFNDRQRSEILSTRYRDATTWNDQLANLNSPWETSGSPTVSGGKIYASTVASTISVALRPITFTDTFRYIVPVDFKDGLATLRMHGILATTDTAATIQTGNLNKSVGIYIDATPTGNRMVFAQAFGVNELFTTLPAGNKQYVMGMTFDPELGLGVFIRALDGTFEKGTYVTNALMASVSSWRPTKVGMFSIDNRGSATATGYGPIGFRASLATVGNDATGRQGVEGVSATTHMGGTAPPPSGEKSRIALPANYDSRVASPLVIIMHGGGADAWHAYDLGPTMLDSGYIVASGDFRSNGSLYAFGAPQSIDAVVTLYQRVRDRYNIGPVLLAGYSMGGMTAARVVADGRIPGIAGVAIGNPALNLKWVWDSRTLPNWAPYVSSIKTAWGVSTDLDADWAAATAGYDPMQMPASAFKGVPFWISSSPQDTTAIETQNALPFIAKLQEAGSPVTRYVATGDHGDLSAWPFTTIQNWLNARAWT